MKPEPCPYCGFPMDEPDMVDVGVGWVQCGPFHCYECNASQMGPEYNGSPESAAKLGLDADERRTGFYKGRISPLANQHNGKLISYKQADALYRAKYFAEHGNPYNAPIIRDK